ncbi:MAG: hypothetical protein RJA57_1055, partial [Bacteroidota bacterium]
GAAVTSLATEGLIMAVFWSRTRGEIPVRPALQILLSSAVMVPVILITRNALHDPLEQLTAAAGAGAVVYLLTQRFLFRNPILTGKWFE